MADMPEVPFEERRKQTIWERMDEIGQECANGHKRLRHRIEELEKQADTTDAVLRKTENRVEVIERTPPDVTKLRFSTGVVVSIVIVTAGVVGSGYGFSAFVSNKIDALSKRMDEQSAKQSQTDKERAETAQRSIDALTRRVELQGYELQRLREDVTQKKGSSR